MLLYRTSRKLNVAETPSIKVFARLRTVAGATVAAGASAADWPASCTVSVKNSSALFPVRAGVHVVQ